MQPPALQPMENLLRSLLSPDNALRSAAEAEYTQLPAGVLLPALLHLLHPATCQDESIQALAGTLLRGAIQRGICDPATQEQREALHGQLMELLTFTCGSNARAAHQAVAHCIAALAISDLEHQRWPELLPTLSTHIRQGPHELQLSCLMILSHVLPALSPETLAAYRTILTDALTWATSSEDLSVRGVAMEISAGVMAVSDDFEQVFRLAIPQFLAAVPASLQADETDLAVKCLEALTSLAEDAPALFHASLLLAWETGLQCMTTVVLPEAVRCLAVEFLLTLAEGQSAAKLKKLLSHTDVLINGLLDMLATVDHTAAWEITGEDESVEDTPLVDVAFEAVGRIGLKFGGAALEPIAPPLILQWISRPDWQPKFAALMALSQLCEGCQDTMAQRVQYLAELALQCMSNPHPRVRFAVIQCLAQLATYFPVEFRANCFEHGTTALLGALEDPIPRVAAHAALALVNVFDEITEGVPAPVLDQCAKALLQLLVSSTYAFVHANVLAALAAICKAAGPASTGVYGPMMEHLKPLLLHPTHHRSERLRRGRTIICVAHLASAVGWELFHRDAEVVMQAILGTAFVDGDPQVVIIHQNLPLLATAMGDAFIPYLSTIVPVLVQQLATDRGVAIEQFSSGTHAPESTTSESFVLPGADKVVNLDTAQLSERASAGAALAFFVQRFPSAMQPHLETLLFTSITLLRHPFSPPLRKNTSSIVASIVCTAASGAEWVTSAVHSLLQAIQMEVLASVQAVQVAALQQVGEGLQDGALPAELLGQCATVLLDALQGTLQRWRAHDEEEEEEEETEEIADDNSDVEVAEQGAVQEEKLTQEIVDCLRTLLNHHNAFIAAFNATLVHPLCTLLHGSPSREKGVAIHLMTAFMQAASRGPSIELFRPYASPFLSALQHLITTKDPEVVGPAAAGLDAALHCPEWRDVGCNVLRTVLSPLGELLEQDECQNQEDGWQTALCDVLLLLLNGMEAIPSEMQSQVISAVVKLLPVGGGLEQCHQLNDTVVRLYEMGHPAVRDWPDFQGWALIVLGNPLMLNESTQQRLEAIARQT